MKGIQTRLRIKSVEGSEMTQIYGIDKLVDMSKNCNKEDDYQIPLTVGKLLDIGDIQFIITDIRTLLLTKTQITDSDDELPFNFEVIYEVEKV